jgi:2,3-bisphosphoglycerate-dependent phosphoglycerate mutase
VKLYLIRHAESVNNVIYTTTGSSKGTVPDPEITEPGHQQARLLAKHLADPRAAAQHHPWMAGEDGDQGFGLTHLYCSLMTRSILTAQYIAEACGLPLTAHADIFEKGGIYERHDDGTKTGLPGPDRRDFNERFPDLQLPAALGDGGWYDRPPETEEQFLQRSKHVVADIERRHADTGDCVAMVVHGDLLDQLINELVGARRHPENYSNHWVANWACHNTSITRVDYVSGSRMVVYTNRLQHLPPELVTW